MLQLTRLSGQAFALNPDLIERAEATPDTVITLVNGSKYVIGEPLDTLIRLVREYRAELVLALRSGTPAAPVSAAERARSARNQSDGATVVQLHAEPGES